MVVLTSRCRVSLAGTRRRGRSPSTASAAVDAGDARAPHGHDREDALLAGTLGRSLYRRTTPGAGGSSSPRARTTAGSTSRRCRTRSSSRSCSCTTRSRGPSKLPWLWRWRARACRWLGRACRWPASACRWPRRASRSNGRASKSSCGTSRQPGCALRHPGSASRYTGRGAPRERRRTIPIDAWKHRDSLRFLSRSGGASGNGTTGAKVSGGGRPCACSSGAVDPPLPLVDAEEREPAVQRLPPHGGRPGRLAAVCRPVAATQLLVLGDRQPP